MKRRFLEVIYVTWVDSEATCTWTEVGEFKEEEHLLHAIGMLIHQDLNNYVLAVSYDPHLDSAIATLKIPRCSVRKVKSIGVVPLKQKAKDEK